MKWFTSLFMALVLMVSLSACGTEAPGPSSVPLPPPEIDGETTEPHSSDEGEPESSETPEAVSPEGAEPQETPVSNEGATSESPPENEPPETAQNQMPPDFAPTPAPAPKPTPTPAPAEDDSPQVLIAYFTWADNTYVEDPSTVDVDATTSASILAPGNAAQLASWIQQEVGGDLHSIVVNDPYPSNYDECLDRAADEKADDARPALSTHVSSMEDYDIVFLGFPNWWYTLPMPVLSFVDEYDWSGKTVVPFVTHGTSGLSTTVRDLTAALPDDVTVLDPIGVYRQDVPEAQGDVQRWIAGLDLDLP